MHNWLSFLKVGKNDQKRGFKFDSTEKNRNIGAQLQSILYTTAQKRFWKIYFL